jgi:unsaturated chondroitin disaccharide hydrolase
MFRIVYSINFMIKVDPALTPSALIPAIDRMWQASAEKILSLESGWTPEKGSPVFTIEGKYTSRGWTEWTQGFQFGAAILQFDATGDPKFLEMGRKRTLEFMATHVTHIGVHDHGFNNVSTYGNLLRLMVEGRTTYNEWEKNFYEFALKASGAVQASRWSTIAGGGGYIYSFNGPHSLFVDTIRSLRALAVGHRLGHVLTAENDKRISLLDRLVQHAEATAKYSIYYGEGRDSYDIRGRAVHEAIFNRNDGNFRCPSSQQGHSPFSTWTRGLAWAMCGFAEQLEFFETLSEPNLESIKATMRKAAQATCDFYLEHTPTCGVPYWDTGAPNLHRLGDYLDRSAEPFNDWEPVDSSAAAIGAQGLIRLGKFLNEDRYTQAGLTVLKTLLEEPYLSTDPKHEGLLLHSVYHRPNGWDHIPAGRKVPCGESCMWGDYHLRELALLVERLAKGKPYLTFWA